MDAAAKGCFGIVAGIAAFFVVLFLVVSAGMVITGTSWGLQWVIAPFRGAVDARNQIQGNGNFRIQAYNSFYNQCSSIQYLEGDADSQLALLQSSTNDNDKRIINANLAALEGTRAGAIARYNTESHKQWTVAQFKSEALIYEIPTSPYLTFVNGEWKKGNKTVCVVD